MKQDPEVRLCACSKKLGNYNRLMFRGNHVCEMTKDVLVALILRMHVEKEALQHQLDQVDDLIIKQLGGAGK